VFVHLTQDAVEVNRILCIQVYERSKGSQSLEIRDHFIAALVSIQMSIMAFASREALGCDCGRTGAVNLDDFPGQG